ncbi:MAG: response regulator [Alphaproteobacteria bacterium]|nr:response regulator [Alphaproteobacteria bacterium]
MAAQVHVKVDHKNSIFSFKTGGIGVWYKNIIHHKHNSFGNWGRHAGDAAMKILLVEDDRLFCDLISKALARKKYEVTCARDGNEALVRLQQDKFDLMITDLFMPNKEGIEIIQEVKAVNKDMKIIAMSSGGQLRHSYFLRMAKAFGADATLQKPFGPEDLIEKIDGLNIAASATGQVG